MADTQTQSHSITVDVPIRTAYDQWTQLETFPAIMPMVREVVQVEDDVVFFSLGMFGRRIEFRARIVEQIPEDRIVWTSVSGKEVGGIVRFTALNPEQTQIVLDIRYERDGFVEIVGDELGLLSERLRDALQGFKQFVEARGRATGAWRGEIRPGSSHHRSAQELGRDVPRAIAYTQQDSQSNPGGPMSKSQSSHSVVVNVPITTAYNQWTQFEDFPKFMGGVEQVHQVDPDLVHFVINVAGRRVEYDAKIVEQEPDRRIVWRSIAGKKTGGMVSFRPIDANRTEVTLDMMYEPEGVLENVGDLVGLVSMRTRSDLQNFKQFIEARKNETGAWRGEIHPGGLVDQPSEA